jgi:MerR family transcriptional regulator, mercuric resistance operon regulatory protein
MGNKNLDRETYPIGELASLSGVRVETIRYFERIGLLSQPQRTPGGHRLFSSADLERLNFVRRAREMGFSQAEVRILLSLSSTELISCGEVKAIAEKHLTMVRQKIADLQELERSLSSTVAQCSGGKVPKCPVIDGIAAEGCRNATTVAAKAQ